MSVPLREMLETSSIYLPTIARIADVKPMTRIESLFTIELPDGLSLDHQPGQFVEVSVFGVGEAPISISSSPSRSNGTLELCIRRVGDLTNIIHTMKPGETLGIRGPFGNGFPVNRFRGKDLMFILGGLGLPPARSLINQVIDNRGNYGRLIILYGARAPSDFLFTEELALWEQREDVELHLAVEHPDEKWKGNVGVVTTLIPKVQLSPSNTIVVTIGPPIMYRFVLVDVLGKGIREGNIWLSLERRMKCGVGKCGHCQIHQHYTCKDGPCFSYAQLKNLQEAL